MAYSGLHSVLITSISSKIGLQISVFLAQTGLFRITGTYQTLSPSLKEIASKYQINLYQFNFLERIPFNPGGFFDFVIHTTAISVTNNADMIRLNIASSMCLRSYLESLSKPPKKLINLSAFSIYEGSKNKSIDDHSLPSPLSPYSCSKLSCESLFNHPFSNGSPNIYHLRIPGILMKSAKKSLLPRVYAKMLRNDEIHICNPDSPFSLCLSITSLSHFILHLFVSRFLISESSINTFPLWSKPDITFLEAFSLVADHLEYSIPFVSEESVHKASAYSQHAINLGFSPEPTSSAIRYWLQSLV